MLAIHSPSITFDSSDRTTRRIPNRLGNLYGGRRESLTRLCMFAAVSTPPPKPPHRLQLYNSFFLLLHCNMTMVFTNPIDNRGENRKKNQEDYSCLCKKAFAKLWLYHNHGKMEEKTDTDVSIRWRAVVLTEFTEWRWRWRWDVRFLYFSVFYLKKQTKGSLFIEAALSFWRNYISTCNWWWFERRPCPSLPINSHHY